MEWAESRGRPPARRDAPYWQLILPLAGALPMGAAVLIHTKVAGLRAEAGFVGGELAPEEAQIGEISSFRCRSPSLISGTKLKVN